MEKNNEEIHCKINHQYFVKKQNIIVLIITVLILAECRTLEDTECLPCAQELMLVSCWSIHLSHLLNINNNIIIIIIIIIEYLSYLQDHPLYLKSNHKGSIAYVVPLLFSCHQVF